MYQFAVISGVDPGGGDGAIAPSSLRGPPNKNAGERVSFYLNTRIYPVKIAPPLEKNWIDATACHINFTSDIPQHSFITRLSSFCCILSILYQFSFPCCCRFQPFSVLQRSPLYDNCVSCYSDFYVKIIVFATSYNNRTEPVKVARPLFLVN